MPSTSTTAAPEIMALYQALEAKVRALRPNDDLTDLESAFRFAREKHGDQLRDSGEPFVTHLLAVTDLLADMQMDNVGLVTGLLHDIVEDTGVKLDEIKQRFGEDVARCVDGVTKLRRIEKTSREERQAENLRKMLLAMTSDIRVIIVN